MADMATLDRSVASSDKFIAEIQAALKEHSHDIGSIADSWITEIDQVNLKRKLPEVVIGVVGATGSGKSSIINAVLGETQLVPTNCMRACTAVITEISYNKDSGSSGYKAIIDFVSLQQWKDELELLLGDIVSGGKVNGNINDDGSEAGIAMAKVQAVYPHLNKNNLAKASVIELLNCDYIKDVLDAQIEFHTSTAEELHHQIQCYVDSKEKLTADFTQHGLRASSSLDEIAYWPLIRTVRIQTKADILKSGSVLVDLPGIADSNAARAAIAQKYLQNCAALWVIAPIVRAVDDKSARSLLGEGFKRQLWRDGTLQRVTFICSKTDEISISEARAALQRYSGFSEKLAIIDDDRAETVKTRGTLLQRLAATKQEIETAAKTHKELDSEEQEYKKLAILAKSGNATYPLVRSDSRKRPAAQDTHITPIKRTRYENQLSKTFESPNKRPLTAPGGTNVIQAQYRQDDTKPQLTPNDVKVKLVELKAKKRELKASKKQFKEMEIEQKVAMIDNKNLIAAIDAREWNACVLGRNEVSASAIRVDFAAGVKDITRNEDEEEHEEDDEGGIENEDEDADNADDVAQEGFSALPVFCVSARGYHKMLGDMPGEKIATYFGSLDDTGVPALREHVKKLGDDKLAAVLESYVDATTRLLTSLRLWSSGDNNSSSTNANIINSNEERCLKLIESFVSAILKTGKSVMDAISKLVKSTVFDTLPAASGSATQAAVLTAMQWMASRKSDNPGLHYQTFKAVVRRDGAYAQTSSNHDFNADLLQPFMRRIDTHWNETFNVRIDQLFREALKEGAVELEKFVGPFGDQLVPHGTSSEIKQTFEDQMKLFTRALGATFKTARKAIEERQKVANRVEESVKTQMKRIYTILENERGTGAYDRCREKTKAYLDDNKKTIFNKVAQKITTELQTMLRDVDKALQAELETSCNSLKRDCRYLCQKSRDFEALPESAQKAILRVLTSAVTALNEVSPTEDAQLVENEIDTAKSRAHSLPIRSSSFFSTSANPDPVASKQAEWSVTDAESESSSESESDDEDEDEEE